MIKLGFRRYASQVDHRSIEAPITRFPTTSGQWYEYCISSFHNVHYYLFLSRSKLTSPLPALVRGSQNHWSSVVAYSAYSGMRNNDCWCDHIGLIVYSAISLALLEFHLTLMWSGCKSQTLPPHANTESDFCSAVWVQSDIIYSWGYTIYGSV